MADAGANARPNHNSRIYRCKGGLKLCIPTTMNAGSTAANADCFNIYSALSSAKELKLANFKVRSPEVRMYL